jgi:putative ABC transport system permease protein
MFRHYLLIAIRTINRQKLFSTINIAGLAAGLTTFILIALYIQYEYSFDTFQKNYENIYRVEQIAHLADKDDHWTSSVYPMGEAMVKAFPEIENSVAIRGVWGEYLSSREDLTFYEEEGIYAQQSIFDIFSFHFIEGEPAKALVEPFSIVLTENLAKKYFQDEPALGKIITAKNRFPYKVTGVIEDVPENSEFNELTYISSISSIEEAEGWTLDNWGNYSYFTYILVNPKSNVEQLESKIEYFLDEKKEDKSTSVTLWLLPFSKVHIDPDPDNKGLLAIIYLYAAVAIFALLIACINFINLTTAYSAARAREIGIKKVVGSDRKSLIFQFLTESILFAVIATQIAFILAEFSLPLFNRIVSRNLDIQYFDNWIFILFIFSIALISGFLAGIYPAFYLSRFKPVKVLKGNSQSSGRNNLFRKVLVILQFVISTMLILSTILLYRQLDFLKNKDMGFNKYNILFLTIDAGQQENSRHFETIRNQLLKDPDIINATISESIPFYHSSGSNFNWEGNDPDEKINMRRNRVDVNYLDTYGMEIVTGRNFSRDFATDSTEACLINETAARIFGWEDPVGKRINDNHFTVVGVVKDFHPNAPFEKIPPFIMLAHNEQLDQFNTYSIRIRKGSDPVETKKYVEEVFGSFFPDASFESRFITESTGNKTFQIYEAVTSTFGFFAIVTIIISIVGLFGLVAYSTRSRTKEIGIRKVHGATLTQIFLILIKDFFLTIGIAIMIAWPLGSMIRRIDPAYYKVPVNYWEYGLTAVLVILITLLTVSFHTLKAAKGNPIEALRYE